MAARKRRAQAMNELTSAERAALVVHCEPIALYLPRAAVVACVQTKFGGQ